MDIIIIIISLLFYQNQNSVFTSHISLASERQILHLPKKFFQTSYIKLNKGFATWFSTFCENFALILKNHKNKAKRQLPFFHVPYMPYFKWNVSFTKVLQKCSLTQVKILCSFWNCKNCIKMGKHKIEQSGKQNTNPACLE